MAFRRTPFKTIDGSSLADRVLYMKRCLLHDMVVLSNCAKKQVCHSESASKIRVPFDRKTVRRNRDFHANLLYMPSFIPILRRLSATPNKLAWAETNRRLAFCATSQRV